MEHRPTVEEDKPPLDTTEVDPTAAPGGSNRPRRFKKSTPVDQMVSNLALLLFCYLISVFWAINQMFRCSTKHMEDLKSSAQTDKQSQADPKAEVAPTAPMSWSPSARGLAEQTTTAASGAGDGEGLASAEAGSATMPKAMSGSTVPLGDEL